MSTGWFVVTVILGVLYILGFGVGLFFAVGNREMYKVRKMSVPYSYLWWCLLPLCGWLLTVLLYVLDFNVFYDERERSFLKKKK